MSDKLHWSFDDSPILTKKVFAEGFSANETTLPQSAFDSSADWENSYDVIYAGPQDFSKDDYVYYGSLRVGVRFEKERLTLSVRGIRQLNQDYRCERQYLQAESVCRRDDLFSVEEGAPWSLRLRLKNQRDPATKPYAEMDETGCVQQDGIEKNTFAGKRYTYRISNSGQPVVSDWALLASVQTLPRDREFQFGYFQQLERYAAGHRIRFLETIQASFGGHDMTLHGYAQTGPGITPSFYWVDDHGRLLIARFALSALVYNSNPRLEKEAAHDS